MYKAILVPIDLAHESSWDKALPVAVKLADAFDAELHVVNVVQDIRTSMVAQYFPKDFEETSARHAAEELSKLVGEKLKGRKVTEHLAVGQVYRQIVETADKAGCDLIVMASHRPELTDILIGPNADHVVRSTPQSVMVVRP